MLESAVLVARAVMAVWERLVASRRMEQREWPVVPAVPAVRVAPVVWRLPEAQPVLVERAVEVVRAAAVVPAASGSTTVP